MNYNFEDVGDIHLSKPNSASVNNLLEKENDNITSEAMVTIWLDTEPPKNDIKITLTKWYKKRYKIFLLHFGSPITEINVDNNKVEYFLDMGVGGSGFTYRQILDDFFANIETEHGVITECEVFFL